ncbi:dTMP kinase [Sphaerimonospora mesophila]|uniref:dTMP kinase n=1 Tax=Sphaerimonospora mesophila TaxID=37483 RepID=UPI0006E275EC
MSGLFVALDGPGGAGKSTLARMLANHLADAGYPVLATREPSDGPLGQIARHQTEGFTGTALACLVAADRYHHLAAEIQPALAAGRLVVCDRYVPSSYVLQTRDGVPLDYVRQLNALALRPCLAVLVTADPAILEDRLRQRGVHSRFEHDGSSATEVRLYDGLADVLAEDGFPLHRVDTSDVSPQVAVQSITHRIAGLWSRQRRQ